MSIHNVASPDELTRAMLGPSERACFRCGEPVEVIAVCWQGHPRDGESDAFLVLHPDCAEQLAVRLISDGFTAQRIADGKPLLGGIDKTLITQGEG